MATDRRKQILLAAAVIVLAAVGYWSWRQTASAPAETSNGRATVAASGRRQAANAAGEPDVHLDALERERPKPDGAERDLFRFKPKAPPPAPPGAGRGTGRDAVAAPPPAPTGPPPLPPIPLKFIGIIDQGAGKPKIAVLSDGVGPPIHGVEGGTVAGKYKILRIGAESIEMAYLDGRGRQTIRLSGS